MPRLPPHPLHRRASRARAGALQRGHAIRSGSPLGTDSRKTVPLIAAPASRPRTAPAAAHIGFMLVDVKSKAGRSRADSVKERPAEDCMSADRRSVLAD